MNDRFDYFVVFAEMRTGSNFLETNLNAMDGVACHGEAFNPHFIGYPNKTDILGITQDDRNASPNRLIETIKQFSDGLGGFRYFHDHDPRVFDIAMDDPRCAKIILTRNPLESYVSWKIAQETGQWKLTNVKRLKTAKAVFNPSEFEAHVEALQEFQVNVMNRLQTSGQTGFYIDYEDLQSLDIMNGLAQFLGVDARLLEHDSSLKPQNPASLEQKLDNPEALEKGLARLDRFNLGRTPNFEPRRGPVVPSYVACETTPLLYMPIRSGPEEAVLDWMAALDDVHRSDLRTKFNQKDLRQWKKDRAGHRSFTVVRHPVERLHHAFCTKILSTGPGSYAKIRGTLRKFHKLPIPGQEPNDSYTLDMHRDAFISFIRFVKSNLSGQTSIRVDAHWCTQSQAISNMSDFALPDMIVRETEMDQMLPVLSGLTGSSSRAPISAAAPHPYFQVADIYDDQIEQLTQDAYQRDYVMFGFDNWG